MSIPKSKSDHLQDCTSQAGSFLQWWTAAAATTMWNQLPVFPLSQPSRLLEASRHTPLSCPCSLWVVLFLYQLNHSLSSQLINMWSFFFLEEGDNTMEERDNSDNIKGGGGLLTSSGGHNAHSIALSSQTAKSKRIRRLNGNYSKGADCLLMLAGFGLLWLGLFSVGVKKKKRATAAH